MIALFRYGGAVWRRYTMFVVLLCCAAPWGRGQHNTDTLSFRLSAAAENDTALLRWQYLGEGVLYDVYRRLPQEPSSQLLLSTDSVGCYDIVSRSVCRDTVRYYVEAWKGDTLYRSNTMALFFEDPHPTGSCGLQVASVDRATQQLVLTWTPSPDGDAMGYVIHKGSNGSNAGSLWRPYDTVWGRAATRYVCHDLDLTEVHAFRLFAFDSCFQASPLTAPYQNITMKAEVPECSRALHVSWTSYINMPDTLLHYDVLLQQDGGAWRVLTTRNTHLPQWYDYTLPDDCHMVTLAVRAVSRHGLDTAWSNEVTVQLQAVGSIEYLSLDKVSVSDDNRLVRLRATVDSSFLTEGYTLYRCSEGEGWSTIATLPFTGGATLQYDDGSASPSGHEYCYRLGVMDACKSRESYSNEANNVLLGLQPVADNETLLRLSWNDFLPWRSGVHYRLLRKRESDGDWQLVGQTAGLSYIDDLSQYDSVGGGWLYRVEAVGQNMSSVNGPDTVQSNTVRYAPAVRVWLPNAIAPLQEGNARFCVEGKHISATGYELYIYNRLGQQLYHSTNPADCWDGTMGGVAVPPASYVYLLTYRDEAGKECVKKGTVTVIM